MALTVSVLVFSIFSLCFVVEECMTEDLDLGDGRCAESKSWKEDCNSCSCEKGFYPHCTQVRCLSTEREVKHSTLCEPNKMIQRDCNECHCTADGNELICTGRSCVAEVPEAISQLNEQVNMRRVCEPNEAFDKECKRCVCNDEGSNYTCTANFCADDSPNDVEVFNNTEEADHSEKQKVCVPNETFNRDCNTCKCNQDGTDFFCTRKFCLSMEDVEVMEKDQGDVAATFRSLVCSPNESFEKNCNKCHCNEIGTAYSCTRELCKTPSSSDDMETMEYSKQGKKAPSMGTQQKCEPRSVFKLDCNTCQCSDDGTSYYCTRRVCLPGLPEDYDEKNADDKSEVISTPEKNREKRDVEQAKYPEGTRSCTANEEFRLDCNTCLCNVEGTDYSCTRKDCQSQSVSKRSVDNDSVEDCVPGSTFRRGCSTCQCSPDGSKATCTTDVCEPKLFKQDTKSPAELVCKPGESTTRDCNTCVCSEDGSKLTCTERSCLFDDPTQKEIAAEDPDFRCTPGDQFKRECNDCTCSANGKSVFCTLKLCV